MSPEQSSPAHPTGAPEAERAPMLWRSIGRFLIGPYPTLVSRLVLAIVFLTAAVSKIVAPQAFAANIAAYQMIPTGLVQPMALGLPWLELVIAVYLLIGLFLRWTAAVTGALLVVFLIAMGSAMARGLSLDCGCFGSVVGTALLRDQVGWSSVLRDLVLLALAVHLMLVPSALTVDARLRRPADAEL